MTRDGLVEQNLATGEETRVSQRGQEFNLRQKSAGDESRAFDVPARQSGSNRHQPQTQSAEPQGYGPQAPPGMTQGDAPRPGEAARTDAPGLPMEAARPTERSYEARSHETAAGPTPHRRQSAPADQGATYWPGEGAAGDAAPGGASAATAASPAVGEKVGRLNFTEAEAGPKAPHGKASRMKQGKQARAEHGPAPGASESGPAASAGSEKRLKFFDDETPDKKVSKLQSKADHAAQRLEKAREKLPKKRKVRIKRVYDEEKGKKQTKMTFEKEVVPPGKGKLPLAIRGGMMPIKAAGRKALQTYHGKMSEVEDDNVGVKTFHQSHKFVEDAGRGKRRVESAYRFVKDRPYRKVAKLEKKARKANIKLTYEKALRDNPTLKSNPLSRFMQKQKIKRQYAKAARDAKKAGQTLQKGGSMLVNAVKTVVAAIQSHPAVVATIAGVALLFMIISGTVSSCSTMTIGGLGTAIGYSYLADDADMNDAEALYKQWEADLQFEVIDENVRRNRPGYDEYVFDVDAIGHDPNVLMAYLTAAFQKFTLVEVQDDLAQIFAQQYTLTYRAETETRQDADGEDYDYRILYVTLRVRPLSEILAGRIPNDQQPIYDMLLENLGNRQYVGSPFAFDWTPYVSCGYGQRIHPITKQPEFHPAVDIALPAGTPIIAAHDGTVAISQFHNSYGNYIVIDDGKGVRTLYAHCSQLLVGAGREVKAGDVIAKVGTTGSSTGNHLHFEVQVNGQKINPMFFAQTAGTPAE